MYTFMDLAKIHQQKFVHTHGLCLTVQKLARMEESRMPPPTQASPKSPAWALQICIHSWALRIWHINTNGLSSNQLLHRGHLRTSDKCCQINQVEPDKVRKGKDKFQTLAFPPKLNQPLGLCSKLPQAQLLL